MESSCLSGRGRLRGESRRFPVHLEPTGPTVDELTIVIGLPPMKEPKVVDQDYVIVTGGDGDLMFVCAFIEDYKGAPLCFIQLIKIKVETIRVERDC